MRTLQSCKACPRCCGVDRQSGALGFCRAGGDVEIYRYGPHHGEEPPLVGSGGSGTIFFSRCTLRCIYCQNHPWSQQDGGTPYTQAAFKRVLRELYDAGCHNWNMVSPTPWLDHIVDAITDLSAEGVRLPVVYNTSGFETVSSLQSIESTVDIYLSDLRYACPQSAQDGSGYAGYTQIARHALQEMWHQKGPLHYDAEGIATRGTICRLLILPGRANEVIDNLHWLADTIGPTIPVSIMAQYTPAFHATHMPTWDRRISQAEYDRVAEVVNALDFTTGWMQAYDDQTPDELIGFTMTPGSGI